MDQLYDIQYHFKLFWQQNLLHGPEALPELLHSPDKILLVVPVFGNDPQHEAKEILVRIVAANRVLKRFNLLFHLDLKLAFELH